MADEKDITQTIAAGIPMSLEEMRLHLQNHYSKPVALRKEGATSAKCPFSGTVIDTPPGPGYFRYEPVGTGVYDPNYDACTSAPGIIINDRYFTANYGFLIIEYRLKDDTYHIIE